MCKDAFTPVMRACIPGTNIDITARNEPGGAVADIVFLSVIVAFFVLCAGYVWACGRIIGTEPAVDESLWSDDADLALPTEDAERAA
jgi:hypothetical protein